MTDLHVIADRAAASSVLDPVRSSILGALAEPGSATTVAASLGMARQKVNYHLRALEEHGLVRLVEERPRRGLTERVMVASARSYLLSSEVLGANAPTTDRIQRMSSRYLIAVAGRMIREVAELVRLTEAKSGPDARPPDADTLTIDTEIRLRSAAERAAFTTELAEAVTTLAAKYHDGSTPGGRWHRLVVAAHPHPPSAGPQPQDGAPPSGERSPSGEQSTVGAQPPAGESSNKPSPETREKS